MSDDERDRDTLAIAIRAEAEIADRPGQMDRLRDLSDQVEALGDAVDLVGENFDRQAAELAAARRETAVVTRESRRRIAAATSRAERAEAAIRRVRTLADEWRSDPGWAEIFFNDAGDAILAALDGTDNTGGTNGN